MPETQAGAIWEVIAHSVRGASHLRSGLPNQDYVDWEHSHKQNEEIVVLAVADGHGSKRSFRSDRGSRFAVQTAIELLTAFYRGQESVPKPNPSEAQRLSSIDLPRRIVQNWEERVDADDNANPIENDPLMMALSVEDRAAVQANRLLAYGSTLLAALVTPEYVLYLQLGDGDILIIDSAGQTYRPLPPDDRQFANETVSLCSPGGKGGPRRPRSAPVGAWGDFRVRLVPHSSSDRPPLILVTTDGYPNSYKTDADFLKVGADFLDALRSEGIEKVRLALPEWLEEASKSGSGDDVTVGLIIGSAALAPMLESPKLEVPPNEAIKPGPSPKRSLLRRILGWFWRKTSGTKEPQLAFQDQERR